MNKEISKKKNTDKPSAQKQPNSDTLVSASPVLLEVKPNGEWERKAPGEVDEEKLKSMVSQLIDSNMISAAQSYCFECNKQNQEMGSTSRYVPVIMMPILPANQYPFELDSTMQEKKEMDDNEQQQHVKASVHDKNQRKPLTKTHKRFSNFDLESQW